jgi:hypothetical protein
MKKISYPVSLFLTPEQVDFLMTRKYSIDRMKALMTLVGLAYTEDAEYKMKGFETDVRIGQAVISEVELSKQWECDRKTVSRLLDQMHDLGIVSSEQTNRTSIHTLYCIEGWHADGLHIDNPFFKRQKERFGIKELAIVNPNANSTDNKTHATLSADDTSILTVQKSDEEIPNRHDAVQPSIYNKVEDTDQGVTPDSRKDLGDTNSEVQQQEKESSQSPSEIVSSAAHSCHGNSPDSTINGSTDVPPDFVEGKTQPSAGIPQPSGADQPRQGTLYPLQRNNRPSSFAHGHPIGGFKRNNHYQKGK